MTIQCRLLVLISAVFMSIAGFARPSVHLKEQEITYSINGKSFKGYIVYNSDQRGKRPAVLVVHEWWGLNDYPRKRARQLAELGYIAMAVDMYGDGAVANNPQEAQKFSTPFYQNPNLSKERLDAAISQIRKFPETDPSKIAAIGYCFGGTVVLTAANLGSDLKGVVSFHGGLAGVPAEKNRLKVKMLVCHGLADQFVSQKDVSQFRHRMDSVHSAYTFRTYPNASHAFSNPEATAYGKKFNLPIAYNADADKKSWNDMKSFFKTIF
jgi:dienelactone hydrolase